MAVKTLDVPELSHVPARQRTFELIDAKELARRWQVPESWVRSRTRTSTPPEDRIPCVRFGRYIRFEWGSPQLEAYIAKHRS
jgi:hypothetical protein